MKQNKQYIHQLVNLYDIDTMAAYCCLKPIFSNSIFYNFSIKSIAKKSDQCLGTTKKMIKLLLDAGAARIEGKNLILVSKRKLDGVNRKHQFKNGFIFIKSKKYKHIKNELQKYLLLKKLKECYFAKRVSYYKSFSRSIKDFKFAKKADRKYKIGNFNRECKITIGFKKLSEAMQCSTMHASRLVKDFTKQLKIKFFPGQIKEVFKDRQNHYIGMEYIHYRECSKYVLPAEFRDESMERRVKRLLKKELQNKT